jgi:hypothetical protein
VPTVLERVKGMRILIPPCTMSRGAREVFVQDPAG